MHASLQRYLRWHRALGHSSRTIHWHQTTIQWLIQWMEANELPTTINELHVDYIRQWIDDQMARGLSTYTIASRIRSLKAFTAWLVAEEWLERDPLQRLTIPRVDELSHEILTPDDVARLLAACPQTVIGQRDRAIMLLLYSTGIRAGELIRIELADVNLNDATVLIKRAKSRRFRVVPLSPKLEKAIIRYINHPGRPESERLFVGAGGRALTTNSLYLMLRRRGRAVGLHANPHKWRHSSAIQYLRSGGRVEVLKELLGHSTITMTLHYARIVNEDVINAHLTADPLHAVKLK